jgi:putative Ca2+/H+ antiporter (TMEM165/GDT1 family)
MLILPLDRHLLAAILFTTQPEPEAVAVVVARAANVEMAESVAKVVEVFFAFSPITTAQTELFKIVSICLVLEAKAVRVAQVVLVV